MAKKTTKEEIAWQEYLASIEEKPEEKKRKGFNLNKSIHELLKKIGLEKEKENLKDEAAITAKEAKADSPKKQPLKKMDASSLEKYFKRIEDQRKLEAEIAKNKQEEPEKRKEKLPVQAELVKEAAKEIEQQLAKKEHKEKKPEEPLKKPEKMPAALAWKKPFLPKEQAKIKKPKEQAKATKEKEKKKAAEAKAEKTPEKKKKQAEEKKTKKEAKEEKPAEKTAELTPKPGQKKGIGKKIVFLPKAIKEAVKGKKEEKEKTKEESKKKPKKKKPVEEKKGKKKEEKEASKEEKKPEPEKGEALAEFLSKRPSLAEFPVSEIRKMPKEEIERHIKMEKLANKTRGWYGDRLRHKKAALVGWRVRKKAALHNLRKKEKNKKLSKKERKKKKKLLSDDRGLRERVKTLDEKIKTLKRIAKQKENQEKALEEKAKEVGVEMPKAETKAIEKGRKKFKKKTEMSELIDAMRGVADEMAAVATRQDMGRVSWKQALTVDDQISAQERLIKGLEKAFYKRKVDFDQFREKLFEYQSKLAELKIKKRLAEERKKSLPLEIRQAMEKPGFEKTPMAKQPVTATLSTKAVKALEKMARKPGSGKFQEQASEAIKKLAEEETERKTETMESKRFAEKTTEALQKIADRINAVPSSRTQSPPPQAYWPPPQQQPSQQKPPQQATPTPAKPLEPKQEQQKPAQRQQPQPAPPQWAPPTATPSEPASRMVVEKGKPRRGRKPKKAQRVIQNEIPDTRPSQKVIERIIERPGMQRMRKAIEADEREEALKEKRIEKRENTISKREKEGKGKKILDRIKEKIVPGAKHKEAKRKIGRDLDKAIREKAAGHISGKQVDRIEEKLGELLERYKIPENALAAHVQTLDSNRLVQDFQKLISLIERKKENAADELIKPAPGFDISTGVIAKKREKLIGKEKDIIKTKIETSFDRLLRLVQLKGIINLNEAAKQLGMDKKDVQECAEILERNKLIQLSYPPIGAVKLVYPGYLEWKQKQKKKEKEEKKKNKK